MTNKETAVKLALALEALKALVINGPTIGEEGWLCVWCGTQIEHQAVRINEHDINCAYAIAISLLDLVEVITEDGIILAPKNEKT